MTQEEKINLIQETIEYQLLEYIKPNNKLNISKVSENTKIDRKTIKKYLDEFFFFKVNEEVSSSQNNASKRIKISFYRTSEIPHYLNL